MMMVLFVVDIVIFGLEKKNSERVLFFLFFSHK